MSFPAACKAPPFQTRGEKPGLTCQFHQLPSGNPKLHRNSGLEHPAAARYSLQQLKELTDIDMHHAHERYLLRDILTNVWAP